AVAVDAQGNLYIADTENNRIRKVDANGVIRTIAGDGLPGLKGDGGPALEARLRWPVALAVDRQGNVYVADRDNHRIRVLVPAVAAEPLQMPTATVLHAASLLPGPVAPGQLVTIQGIGIGPAGESGPKLEAGGKLARQLNGVEVLWDGRPSPLLYVSRDEINVQAPYAIAGQKETLLEVKLNGDLHFATTLAVAEAAPALFTTGNGQAAAINEDGTLNSAENPAPRGSIVTFFATGEGCTEPASEEGRLAAAPLPRPVLPVTLTIGVHPAEILWAGSAPGLAGVLQINARIPAGFLPAGTLPVELNVGGHRSPPGVTIVVR
ncbi:MAG: hypothetical protein ACP5U2_17805, partial [Bryobacteraceae bacterium]